MSNSDNRVLSHWSFAVKSAFALYSASAEERETVSCFCVLQEIGESPNCTIQPVSERRVSGHPPQSESHHPVKCLGEPARSKIPCPIIPFRYWTTLNAASQWSSRGLFINCERIWIEYARSGRVAAKYIRRPTRRRYVSGSARYTLSEFASLWFCSIGDPAGRHPRRPTSATILDAYFLWQR